MCANDVDRPPGTVVYTQMLNERGGIECDVTATRLADDRFRIVTGTAFGRHDLSWLTANSPRDGSVQIRDVTGALACIGVWGPRARDILQPLTNADLSNDAFPYLSARQIAIGPVPCFAARVTYVGELGWELYCSTEYGLRLWDTVWSAGRPYGLVAGGYRAIDSLRLEKGYRAWGTELTPDTTPMAAGLEFAVRLDKGVDFIGADSLRRHSGEAPEQRLACLVLDDPRRVVLGEEPVSIDGRIAGRVTSGGFGFSVERSIAYAYLPAEEARPGRAVEVDVFGDAVAGSVAEEPLFDPKGERIRA